MSGILETFLSHLVASFLMWLLLCAILVAVFARDDAGRFVVGMLRIAASVFYSPFVFLRGAIQRVVLFATGEADFAGSEQYLLNRLMLTLQAIVIVIAVASLAAGGVMTWNALMPPEWARDAVKLLSSNLEATKTRSANADGAVARADEEWTSLKKAAMDEYVASRRKTIGSLRATNAELIPLINATGGYAPSIFNMVQGAAASGDPSQTARRARQMESTVSSYYYYYVDDTTRSRIRSWISNWERQETLQYEIATSSESAVREALHPDYSGLVEQKSRVASEVTSIEAQLKTAREEAALRWGGALWMLLRTGVSFILLVWLLGLAVEGAWMLIRVADDVRKIREATPQSAAVSPLPNLPLDRLPIRREPEAAAAELL
jgi:hypothetical protein